MFWVLCRVEQCVWFYSTQQSKEWVQNRWHKSNTWKISMQRERKSFKQLSIEKRVRQNKNNNRYFYLSSCNNNKGIVKWNGKYNHNWLKEVHALLYYAPGTSETHCYKTLHQQFGGFFALFVFKSCCLYNSQEHWISGPDSMLGSTCSVDN